MQENALHGWRLSDGQHMRMSGYPAKTTALSLHPRRQMAGDLGRGSIVLWPFFGGGPMGKAPTELAGGDGVLCTRSPATRCTKRSPRAFPTGWWCWPISPPQRILPIAGTGRGRSRRWPGARTAPRLAFGTETGFRRGVDFSKR